MFAHQKGVGLVELMITILIGMIIMTGLIAVATATFGANSGQMQAAQLNNELRHVADLLARDLRRAAYNGTQGTPANTTQSTITITPLNNSVSFSYRENDGDANLRDFTYSLVTNGGVGEVRLQVGTGTAQSLTDNQRIHVSTFTVENTDSIVVESCDEFRITSPVYRITVVGNLRRDPTTVRRVIEEVRPRNQQVAVAAACPT